MHTVVREDTASRKLGIHGGLVAIPVADGNLTNSDESLLGISDTEGKLGEGVEGLVPEAHGVLLVGDSLDGLDSVGVVLGESNLGAGFQRVESGKARVDLDTLVGVLDSGFDTTESLVVGRLSIALEGVGSEVGEVEVTVLHHMGVVSLVTSIFVLLLEGGGRMLLSVSHPVHTV